MAEKNKVQSIIESIPPQVWLGAFALIAANSVWSDAKDAAKKFGENTKGALEEVERSKTALIDLPEFKPNYFSNYLAPGTKVKLLPQRTAVQLAKDFKRVKGFFNDDEDLLYTTLQKIPYLTQLAQVAEKFLSITGNNLGAYIVSFTNTNERHRIEKIIHEMKSGIL